MINSDLGLSNASVSNFGHWSECKTSVSISGHGLSVKHL